jgi:hypothetical protein
VYDLTGAGKSHRQRKIPDLSAGRQARIPLAGMTEKGSVSSACHSGLSGIFLHLRAALNPAGQAERAFLTERAIVRREKGF